MTGVSQAAQLTIISLIPRSPDRDDNRRSPIVIAALGTILGAVGLLVHTVL